MAAIERLMRDGAETFLRDGFEAPYVAASYYLIEHFVSKQAANDHLVMVDDGAGGRTMNSDVSTRIATIGETLFRFRNSPCVTEFAERMATRDLRSAFSEALVASFFLDAGFDVLAVKETGKKGSDFDFRVRLGEAVACIEVTTLQPPKFSDSTLENALGAKVDQLPKHLPSAIVVAIPEAWMLETDAVENLSRHARRVFGYSGRVNYICFLSEQHDTVVVSGRPHGILQYRLVSCASKRARNACPELDFLSQLRGNDLSTSEIFSQLTTDKDTHRAFRNRPFFLWVDDLVGRAT